MRFLLKFLFATKNTWVGWENLDDFWLSEVQENNKNKTSKEAKPEKQSLRKWDWAKIHSEKYSMSLPSSFFFFFTLTSL